MELVTIKTFDNPIDAHILKSKLESENIKAFLFDENIVGLMPLYNLTVGGIKLKINKSDFDDASKILEESNRPLTNEQNEVITCPKCQSEDIYNRFISMKGVKGILSAIISFALMLFPIYYRSVNKCKSCGNEF